MSRQAATQAKCLALLKAWSEAAKIGGRRSDRLPESTRLSQKNSALTIILGETVNQVGANHTVKRFGEILKRAAIQNRLKLFE